MWKHSVTTSNQIVELLGSEKINYWGNMTATLSLGWDLLYFLVTNALSLYSGFISIIMGEQHIWREQSAWKKILKAWTLSVFAQV